MCQYYTYLVKALLLLCLIVESSSKAIVVNNAKRQAQLANFFAGGIAGTVASTLTMPLEVVKTQFQSSRNRGMKAADVCTKILQTDGPKGFYKGLQTMLVGIIPTRAIYFWAYGTTKSYLNTTLGNSPANHLLSAFSAGITSNTITNPLWMVKTRFQIIADTTVGQRKYGSYGEVVQTIMKEEGPLGFFKGITASYIGCFEGAIQWIAYEKFKTLLSVDMTTKEDRTPSPTEYFFAAAGAKFIAVCATYPHEVVRTRLREQATNGLFKYKGFFGTLSTIAKEEGRKGLYGGMGMHLGRSVPNAAVMFVTFELVSSYLNKRSNMQQQTLAVQTSENEEQ